MCLSVICSQYKIYLKHTVCTCTQTDKKSQKECCKFVWRSLYYLRHWILLLYNYSWNDSHKIWKKISAFEAKGFCKILIDPLAVMNQLVLVFNVACSLVKMLIRFFFSLFFSLRLHRLTQFRDNMPFHTQMWVPSHPPPSPQHRQQSAWLCSFQCGPLY